MKEELLLLENQEIKEDLYYKEGVIPVLITSPHTIRQHKEDGSIKLPEPFTKAINMYISNKLNAYSIIKTIDTGIDSNSDTNEIMKDKILQTIKENNIKLQIDIHGAIYDREFDVEFGTLNNLSADFSTIKELKEAFIEHKVFNVTENDPFKGGGITRKTYGDTNIDVVQIEINQKYRDINNIENIEKIIDALISFIKQYVNMV